MKIENTGSFVLVTPETVADSAWIDENVVTEGWMWMGKSLAVDARMIDNLVSGMLDDGLKIDDEVTS